jgi:hypothetical protein
VEGGAATKKRVETRVRVGMRLAPGTGEMEDDDPPKLPLNETIQNRSNFIDLQYLFAQGTAD